MLLLLLLYTSKTYVIRQVILALLIRKVKHVHRSISLMQEIELYLLSFLFIHGLSYRREALQRVHLDLSSLSYKEFISIFLLFLMIYLELTFLSSSCLIQRIRLQAQPLIDQWDLTNVNMLDKRNFSMSYRNEAKLYAILSYETGNARS